MNLRRKRMILMRDVWYGYNRTASGNPVTLEAAKRLRQLTIYGNAVQDGTPSPDAPVEVQLCGDRTGNLYNVNDKYKTWNTAVTDDAGWITVNYDNTEGTADFWSSLFTNFRDVIEPNTQYTLVTEIEYISGGIIYVTTRASDNNISPFNTHVAYSTAGTYCRTVTSKSNLSDCNVLLRTFGCTRAGDTLTAKFRISLLKGAYTAETIPDYEPYGYKVSGRVEGVNLFDKGNATLGYRLTENGVLHNNDSPGRNSFVSDYIYVDPNTIYSLNYAITISETTGYERACFYDADKQFVSQANAGARTFTTPQNASYVRLCRLQTHLDDTMLLKGSYTAETMPPYEPYQPPQDFAVYLPQQIAKVGDVADTVVIDFEKRTATLVQNCFEYYVTGEENTVATGGNNSGDCYGFLLPIDRKGRATPMLSDRYQIAYTSVITPLAFDDVTIIIGGMGKYVYFYLPFTKYTDLDTFKTYLQEQNNAGDPITILCIRNTPVTTDITAMQDWDAMPQVKGTVTLTLSAEVEPSGAEAVYYSAERGD